jgi:hypothetical protein
MYLELQRSLSYAYHTRDYVFTFQVSELVDNGEPYELSMVCDADHATRDDRKSILGVFGFIENCLIFVHCKASNTVHTSSGQSESDGCFEAWQWGKFGFNWSNFQPMKKALNRSLVLYTPIPIFTDSTAALAILTKYVNTTHVKHFDVKVFAIRDDVADKFFQLIHITREKNIADILTHYATLPQLQQFVDFVYVRMELFERLVESIN